MAPIFIHSSWRTGSTFVYSQFRRRNDLYYAFQEPLNEVALLGRNDPQSILTSNATTAAALRHPQLDRPYFQELHETHAAWVGVVQKSMLYDDFFGTDPSVDTSAFYQALIAASPRCPVFQECRTGMRIAALRQRIGGLHLALIRDPRDSWWSFKVNEFFGRAELLCLNAVNPPDVIAKLRHRMGFEPFRNDDIMADHASAALVELDPADSYLMHFVLWALAYDHAGRAADLVIDMDAISTHQAALDEADANLSRLGIEGITLAGAAIPQREFSLAERRFFDDMESAALALLAESGVETAEVEAYRERRAQRKVTDRGDGALEYRSIILRLESEASDRARLSRERDRASAQQIARIVELEKYYVDLSGAVRELDERLSIETNKVLLETEKRAEAARQVEAAEERAAEQSRHANHLAEQLAAAQGELAGTAQRLTAIENHWVWRTTQFLRRK